MYCKWLLLVACFWGQVWQICDKFLSTPTTPTGYPLLCYSERDTIPRKIILATSYYKNMENYGGLSDCEELVGVTHRDDVVGFRGGDYFLKYDQLPFSFSPSMFQLFTYLVKSKWWFCIQTLFMLYLAWISSRNDNFSYRWVIPFKNSNW